MTYLVDFTLPHLADRVSELMRCFDLYSGFEVKVVTSDNYIKRDSGLMYRDFEVGTGDCPKAGQQVFLSFLLLYFLNLQCCKVSFASSSLGKDQKEN